MSITYDLACLDCKEVIWIGQATTHIKAGLHLYIDASGETRTTTQTLLENFLRKHQSESLNKEYDTKDDIRCHRLVFISDQVDLDDYTVVWDDGTISKWGEG